MSEATINVRDYAEPCRDSSGEDIWLLSLEVERNLVQQTDLDAREVEVLALKQGVLPRRYERNLGTVGWEGQLRLLQSTVGIVGAGGLGGWVIEGLARMGVGKLIVIDRDAFGENNLNRQLLATERDLGRAKVEVAVERVGQVNSAVRVTSHCLSVNEEDMVALLAGSDVIVDALDSLPARFALQRAALRLKVPLVHGAIAGYAGQVMTIFPGDRGLGALYGDRVPEQGMETEWGNPAATPMMTAAWQIHEVVKLLVKRGDLLRHRMLFMDAEAGTIDVLRI